MATDIQTSTLLALAMLVALTTWHIVSKIMIHSRISAKRRETGADVPPTDYQGPLGILALRSLVKAVRAQTVPDELVATQQRMSDKCGRLTTTWKSSLLGADMYWTHDPRNIKAMLSVQFKDFVLGDLRRNIVLPVLGSGIFVQDGHAWERSRALLRPSFSREQIADLDLEEKHVRHLIQILPIGVDGWTDEIDLQTMFFRLTLDTASEFLFGESVDSQLTEVALPAWSMGGSDINRAFAYHFDSVQTHIARRLSLGPLYWLYLPKAMKENITGLNQFIAQYVDIALRKGATPAGEKTERHVFLDELATRTQDPKELRDQLLNILAAGRDTTASLMSWLFHELLRNPEVFKKLRREILDDFGTYEQPRNLTYSGLKQSRYLKQCIDETLRLWPVVPWNNRVVTQLTTLPHGGGPDGESPIVVTPGTAVNFSVHVMHRRKDLWGDDADEFRPERFEGKRPGWNFLPFGGGPRICIGQQFALIETSYVVVRLLQKFDRIETDAERLTGPVKSDVTLTNSPAQRVVLRFHAA